jgi:hypothetical protein
MLPKNSFAECARILALNVAHYASRYGELPIEERLDFLHAEELNEELSETRGARVRDFCWNIEEPKH